ncbi:MAG: hypothetical protein ABIJ57_02575 [Pseudomonadota bacterium]
MKIERVKLRGMTGIKKGLGLDEVSLDLSGLSGLVALAGPNGKGKSTLLESLSPFRTLASRKGALKKHVFLRDSEKSLSFRWNGDLYETLVKIDAQSDRGEAFIYKNGQPEIKGKSSEYDRYMVDLLGSPELFFASVFCAQNSEKLSDMRPGELKNLFSEFLRLHLYEQYEDEAKARRNTLTTQAEALENERKYLEGETAKKLEICMQIPGINELVRRKEERIDFTGSKIVMLNATLKELRKRVEDNRLHEARLKDLQAAGRKLADDWTKEKAAGEKAIADLRAKLAEVEGGITANNLILGRREEIDKASETEAALNRSIQATGEEISTNEALLRDVLDEMNREGQRKVKIEGQVEALKKDDQLRNLKNTIASLKEKKELLEKRDPACTSRTCAFIVSALKAEELPTIEKALADRQALIAEKEKALLEELAAVKGTLEAKSALRVNLHTNIKGLSGKAETDKKALQAARALSSLKTQLDTATAKLEGLEKRKFDLEGDILVKQNDLSLSEGEFQSAFSENKKAVQEAQGQLDIMARADLEQEEQALKDLTAAKESTEKEIASLRADQSALEAQIRDLEEKERRLAEIQEKRAVIIREAGQWEYLKDACGAKGLRALEIDSVAPTISAYANDLLSRTFGPLFQVRFRTQNDEGKEVLDILNIREDVTETLIENHRGC